MTSPAGPMAAARRAALRRLEAMRAALSRMLAASGAAGAVWIERDGEDATLRILAPHLSAHTRVAIRHFLRQGK